MSRFGLSERTAIEAGIYRRASFSQIAKEIGSTARSVSAEIRRNCTLSIAPKFNGKDCRFAAECTRQCVCGDFLCRQECVFCRKIDCRTLCPAIPHSPVCVSNLLHMFAMSASCGEAVSVIAPTMLPHRHMLLL